MPIIAAFEIPLRPTPQKLTISLGATAYNLTLIWRTVPDQPDQEGWVLDIADVNDVAIVNGIPLVTGADLLAQYGYLDFGGQLFVQSDAHPDSVPTYLNLGSTAHLYWLPDA